MVTSENNNSIIKPKEAIKAAMDVVKDFYEGQPIRDLLLEGIELVGDDDCWMVTVGFGIGRTKKTGDTMGLWNQTVEPLREMRVIHLDAKTGNFKKMDPV